MSLSSALVAASASASTNTGVFERADPAIDSLDLQGSIRSGMGNLANAAHVAAMDTVGSEIGGVQDLPLGQRSLVQTAMFESACALLELSNPSFGADRCQEFNDGLLRHGLFVTLQDYNRRLERMRERRRKAILPFNATDGIGTMHTVVAGEVVSEPYSVRSEFASEEWQTIDVMRLQVLPALRWVATAHVG